MFGEWGHALTLEVIPDYPGFLLALLPPGAFIGLGLLLALKNVIDNRLDERRRAATAFTSEAGPAEGSATT
jgi:electron transport complex protein RnfE